MSSPAVEEILGQLPVPQLAAQLGVDDQTVRQAAAAVIPSLLGGLAHNANEGQAQAISDALVVHGSRDLVESGQVDLGRVDAEDGAKIVEHIFGDQSTQLANAVGQRTGTDSSLVRRLMPVLAPVVLAYAGKRLGAASPAGGGGVLGDFLGSILSGGAATESETGIDAAPGAGTSPGGATAVEPSADSAHASEEQQPRSSSSIVDEILGGLFGKR